MKFTIFMFGIMVGVIIGFIHTSFKLEQFLKSGQIETITGKCYMCIEVEPEVK